MMKKIELEKNNKVVFFYPSKIVGGAEMLFYRMAQQLKKRGYDVSYLDYKNGFISNQIKKNKNQIKIINFNLFRTYQLDEGTTLIAPLSFSFTISSFFKGNFYVFLWSIHPKGLHYSIESLHKYSFHNKKKISEYSNSIQRFIRLNGVYFMDLDNFYYQNKIFNLGLSEITYLPIPCTENTRKKIFLENNEVINIGWLGRLSIEKRYSVANIIDNCNKFLERNATEKINLHVIGDGDFMNFLKNKPTNSRLKIHFTGTLVGKNLLEYLLENVDMMFAMGTSALESSSIKIPTILLDHSLIPFDVNNKFRFIYENEGYSLGNDYEERLTKGSHSFEYIINTAKDSKKLKEEGDKCYSYYENNHTEKAVSDLLCSLLNKNKLTRNIIKQSDFGKFDFLERIKFIYSYIIN